jgi:signal transduction histidine kinase
MKIRGSMTGKYFFLFLCIVGLIWYAVYTNYLIGRLQEDATQVTETYAELIRTAISEQMSHGQVNAIFEEIIRDSDIPIVITDPGWNPTMWKNISTGPFYARRRVSPDDTSAAALARIHEKMEKFKEQYDPKIIELSETGAVAGFLVYGNNNLISSLAWMPFLEIGLVSAFTIFVYLALQNIRLTERSNLWVGLAKETAHQLGTPISSLMGWVEFMRTARDEDAEDPVEPQAFIDQVCSICDNMEKDLTRLRKITNRFSQIGSNPTLTLHNINELLEDSMAYFRARLPLLGKRIEMHLDLHPLPDVEINRELIEWVLENLFKNAVDAITREDGLITVSTEYIDCDGIVRIRHTDNGKGISWEDQKKVFSPGYTTKKRGWGLGLTLAKRIVEDYHRGHIYVNWSQKDKGTTFYIDLPAGRT